MPIRSSRKSETYFDFFATSGNEAEAFDYDAPTAWYGNRGLFGGGSTPGVGYRNNIQYVTITTTGNASDFGDLTAPRMLYDGTSDSHGGIA